MNENRSARAGRAMIFLVLASALLATGAGPFRAVAAPGETYALRANAAPASKLLLHLFRMKGKTIIVAPDVTAKVTLDAERESLVGLAAEVSRKAGAGSAVLGNTVLVGGAARLAAARKHPLAQALASGEYGGKRVTLDFSGIRITNLLRILGDVSRRHVEVSEGVRGPVAIRGSDVPVAEVIDALAVSADLQFEDAGGKLRVSLRSERSPRFGPIVDDPDPAPAPRGSCREYLGTFDVEKLKLVAVLTGLAENEALLGVPDGPPGPVKKGSCVGRSGGIVTRVEPDRVVVMEDGEERVLSLGGDE